MLPAVKLKCFMLSEAEFKMNCCRSIPQMRLAVRFLAGPIEGTIIGNVGVQAVAAGAVPDIKTGENSSKFV